MHLVLHMWHSLVAETGVEAAESSIRHLGLACALTSMSTAVGFGSLLLASLQGIQTFGWCCALGSVLSFFAVITVIPLVASMRLSRFLRVRETSRPSRALGPLADRVVAAILQHRKKVMAGGVVLTLALGLVAATAGARPSPGYRDPGFERSVPGARASRSVVWRYHVCLCQSPVAGRWGSDSQEFYMS